MNVQSLRYQPIEGGALGGHFALHVTLGGGDSPGVFTPTELATRIHDVLESLETKCKIKGVLIDCRVRELADLESSEMSSLLGTLKDWGLTIVLWVSQHTRYPWFELATYITVFVTTKHWPNFRVNEIRYVLGDDSWEEPDVYDVNTQAGCYVIPWLSGSMSDALHFAVESKRVWGMIPRLKAIPSIEFKLKEDA